MKRSVLTTTCAIFMLFTLQSAIQAQQKQENIFSGHQDIGNIQKEGNFQYDSNEQRYHITGGGENVWSNQDDFHFAWREMEGNFILRARVQFKGSGDHPHRKTGWMIRQSLEADAPYVDAVVHGDGLTSLQFRKAKGKETSEIRLPVESPAVIQLEKSGNRFIMGAATDGSPMVYSDTLELGLDNTLYAGLFMCSHSQGVLEEAVYNNVRITAPAPEDFVPYEDEGSGSRMEILDVQNKHRKVIYTSKEAFEAPNWDANTSTLIYNSGGHLYELPVEGGEPKSIDTDFATSLNNDHGLSPDGQEIAISNHYEDEEQSGSKIYIVARQGGTPRPVTDKVPSYWHGWSPDGKFHVYTARRKEEFNIYKIKTKGGREKQLTDHKMLDDGPEYSPDGEYIYFNSARTGTMQIWRMSPDGSDKEQITFDKYNDWFPHPSPDGKWLVFVSYPPKIDAQDHPPYKRVMLRMIPTGSSGESPEVVSYLYGGQGTINVPSWSSDSRHLAFVSYSFPGGDYFD
ncbi:MAG: TolB family protein [Bacteroidota bacterium]